MSTEISGPLAEWLADRVPKLAALAHRRYPMVPVDDFEQEIWVRALKRKAKLAKDLREGHEAFVWAELRSAATRLGKEDDRYRRACKAKAAGYRTFDEQFYSGKSLSAFVTVLIEAEGDPAEAVYAATRNLDDGVSMRLGESDPTSFETYMAALIDVRMAMDRLAKGEQRILEAYYGAGDEDTDEGRWDRRKLASSMGMTYETFKQRAYRALRKLQRELGGEDPWRKQDKETAA